MLSDILILSLIASVAVGACMRASGIYDCKSWVLFGAMLWVCIIIAWVSVIALACIF